MKVFKIGKPKKRKIKDGYYVKIDFMHGDADGDARVTAGPFYKDEEPILDIFITMLDKCLKAFPHGKGGFDTYEDEGGVDELKLWNIAYEPFDDEEGVSYDKLEATLSDEVKTVIDRIRFDWPTDPGYGCQAQIMSYVIEYYENNICHNVLVGES